jgi:hypothetical protein
MTVEQLQAFDGGTCGTSDLSDVLAAVPPEPTFMETKTCTKCGTEREFGEFRERKLKSGNGVYRIGECRVCEREAHNKYRLEHPDKCKKALADWKKKNPAKNAAHSRKSYANRRDKCRETQRRWVAANRERYLDRIKSWRARNTEKINRYYSLPKVKQRRAERVSLDRRTLGNMTVSKALREQGIPVTPETLELKREALSMKRLNKQLRQTYKEIFK